MPEQASIIDGKALALEIRQDILARVQALQAPPPGLAMILVGNDPASEIYVNNKVKACRKVGINSIVERRGMDFSQQELITLIASLNDRKDVHGILVQLPLPSHIDPLHVINTIKPEKDVDGLTILNAGHLMTGKKDALVPCTPRGCITLLKSVHSDLAGKKAVIIGRSNLVGKPLAHLLLRENCTVTMCHSKTADLAGECRQADILVAAVGTPKLVQADWIKPGATVLDVGISRLDNGLSGDVDFETVQTVAGALSPVPGGVGPMTIACLLLNTMQAYDLQQGARI